MGSLGESLRREREARGISLEEISRQTKIGVRLLRTIEDEQFDRLPGGIFNKSFVRQYARYVGLDEEVAIQQYLQVLGAQRETPGLSNPPLPQTHEPAWGIGYPRLVVTAVCLGALVAGLSYGVYRFWDLFSGGNRPPVSASTETNPALRSSGMDMSGTQEPASTLPLNDPSVDTGTSTPASQLASLGATGSSGEERLATDRSAEQETSAATSAGEVLELAITSRGTVWLSISADGGKQWQGTMRADQTRQVKAQESVRLTIGDAGAVDLTLNGKPLPSVGKTGEVKTLTITAKGLPAPPL
ncbi:MAG: helix-turn-helix domain-containing protein [Acidobacteria bacterium]|nr:helix-turn-helix domain-containing protein [Acidobacteriota bacterium]